MGKAKTFGYSLMLRTAEEEERAKRLAQKNTNRFEIERRADSLFFYYLPPGPHGSEEMHTNGLAILEWVQKGQGTEPNEEKFHRK